MEQPHVIIHISDQLDGYVFRLRPRSRLWLEEHYPEQYRVASVFIGFDKVESVEQIHESIWYQVANLLTGLSVEELNSGEAFAVVNPSTDQVVFSSMIVHV